MAIIGSFFNANGITALFCVSLDGINLHPLAWPGLPPFRDPSVVCIGGVYYLVGTLDNHGLTNFSIYSSPGIGQPWTFVQDVSTTFITGTGGGALTWAAEWFIDPADGHAHIVIALSTSGYPGGFGIYETHPTTTNDPTGSWSTPVLISGNGGGSGTTQRIDPFLIKKGSSYYLFFKNINLGGGLDLYVGVSSTIAGTYTDTYTNYTGIGGGVEGPSLIHLTGTTWILYYDYNPTDGLFTGLMRYKVSTDDWATWSASSPLLAPPDADWWGRFKHGTMVQDPWSLIQIFPIPPQSTSLNSGGLVSGWGVPAREETFKPSARLGRSRLGFLRMGGVAVPPTVPQDLTGSTGIPTSAATGTNGTVAEGQVLTGSTGIPTSSGVGSTGAGLQLSLHGGTSGIPSTGGSGGGAGDPLGGVVSVGQILTPDGDGIPTSSGTGDSGVLHLIINLSSPGDGIPTSSGVGSGGAIVRGLGGTFGIPSGSGTGMYGTVMGASTSPLGLRVLIAGVDRTRYLRESSLNITLQLGRFSAALSLHDQWSGDYYPEEGDDVVIYAPYPTPASPLVRLFGGQVQSTTVSSYHGTTTLQTNVQCVGYDSILDHRVITKSFQDGTTSLGAMLTTLLALGLGGEHFSIGTLPTADLTIEISNSLDFNGDTCRTYLDKLKEITGFAWYIGNYRDVNFFDTSTTLAPFNLTDDDGNWMSESMIVTRNRSKYRNRQGLRGAANIQATYTDTFVGDGTIYQIFPTAYPLPSDLATAASQVLVKVNGIDKIVATWIDLSLDYDFSFLPGTAVIFANPTKEALSPYTSSDVIEVTYPAPASNIYWYQDGVKIASRASVEGGSGKWEVVADVPSLIAVPQAYHDYAKALVDLYGNTSRLCDYRTLRGGLFPGQIQTMNTSYPPCVGDQIVDTVSIQDVDKSYFQFSIKTVDRPRGPTDSFFLNLLRRTAQPVNKSVVRYTFILGGLIPGGTFPGLTIQNGITNSIPVTHDAYPYEINMSCDTPPHTGQVVIRVRYNGVSIHDADDTLNLPTYTSTDTGSKVFTTFIPTLILRKDTDISPGRLTIDIVEVGGGSGTETGAAVTVVFKTLPLGGVGGF